MIERQLNFFQKSELKNIRHLQKEHFQSVRDCCNTVRSCIRNKLNELRDKIQVGILYVPHSYTPDL